MDGGERRTPGLIVVGMDGSEDGEAAVRHAIAEGSRRGAPVDVVIGVEMPLPLGYPYGLYPLVEGNEIRAAIETAARVRVDEIRASSSEDSRGVPVTVTAVLGDPVPVLVAWSSGAALLVVGHRGRGAFRSRVLGSVGLGCVLHASCPVTVVPQPVARAGEAVRPREEAVTGP